MNGSFVPDYSTLTQEGAENIPFHRYCKNMLNIPR